jgi:hypothetical protein
MVKYVSFRRRRKKMGLFKNKKELRWGDPEWNEERLKRMQNKKEKTAETLYDDWIWVEGFKGTNKDMTCRGFQFERGNIFAMPAGEPIVDCESGFHLCLKLDDVFGYYPIGKGHRFFRVRALVRKSDVAEYGVKPVNPYEAGTMQSAMWQLQNVGLLGNGYRDKLAAKAIEFMYELTPDEIFESTDMKDWSSDEKFMALSFDKDYVLKQREVDTLVSDGYSKPFAELIVDQKRFRVAHSVASQQDLSMDMKVYYILKG